MKFMLLASLLIFSACNGGGSDSGSRDKDRRDARCACLPITYLTINTQDMLPKNLKITLNDRTIFESCGDFPSVAISKKDHQIRFTFSPVVPKVANLEIIDQGEDCNNDASIFDQEGVPYSRKVTSDRPDKPRTEEVTFNL